ncbi:MAG: hypothetical protein K8U57_33740 [Planctomycetes bacterium]|nr:hypothetical protein [Planctomycetota bacterium]
MPPPKPVESEGEAAIEKARPVTSSATPTTATAMNEQKQSKDNPLVSWLVSFAVVCFLFWQFNLFGPGDKEKPTIQNEAAQSTKPLPQIEIGPELGTSFGLTFNDWRRVGPNAIQGRITPTRGPLNASSVNFVLYGSNNDVLEEGRVTFASLKQGETGECEIFSLKGMDKVTRIRIGLR